MCRRVDLDTRLLPAGLAGPRSDERDVRTRRGCAASVRTRSGRSKLSKRSGAGLTCTNAHWSYSQGRLAWWLGAWSAEGEVAGSDPGDGFSSTFGKPKRAHARTYRRPGGVRIRNDRRLRSVEAGAEHCKRTASEPPDAAEVRRPEPPTAHARRPNLRFCRCAETGINHCKRAASEPLDAAEVRETVVRLPLHCRAAVRSGDVHTAGPPGPCGRWACAGRAPTHPQRAPPVTASQASTHLQWPRGQSEMPGPVRTLGPRAWCPRKSGPHPSAVATGATRTTRPLRTLLVIRSSPPHIRSGAARTGRERSAERACANVPSAALHERVSVRSTRQDPANQTFARGTAHVRARVPTCAPGVPTCAPGPHVSTPGRPHVRTRGSYLAGARTRTFGWPP